MQSFDQALSFTLSEEGGYVDDPRDTGRATNRGVTQAVYDDWRAEQKLPQQKVLLITAIETATLYRERYWQPACCESMPLPVAVAHFDWSVNHGVPGAKATLQLCLGVAMDGNVGPQTLAALAQVVDPVMFSIRYNLARRQWYLQRVKDHPDQGAFLKGWLGRCDRLDAFIKKLA